MGTGLIIDAHTHPVGIRMGTGITRNYEEQTNQLGTNVEPGSRANKLIEEMQKYHVDKAIGLAAIGLIGASDLNQQLIQVVREHGEKFPAVMIGFTVPSNPNDFKGDKAAAEIEPYLDLPEVKGIGEWALTAGAGMEDWVDLWPKYRPILDVVAQHKSVVLFHTGAAPYQHTYNRTIAGGKKARTGRRGLWFMNPMFIDDIAAEYPDVPLIIGHIGVQGYFYYGTYADMALLVAARNPNVYLETSSAPFEVIEKAIYDPAIGPDKLIFGSDSPAPYTYYEYKGEYYPSYGKHTPPFHSDHYKRDLANIERLCLPDSDKELILGGNITRLLNL